MKKKDSTKKVIINFWVLLFSFLILGIIMYKGVKLSVVDNIDGTNIKSFALSRNIKETTLTANRGSILDVKGNVLAETVFSYTVTAYLKEKQGETKDNPKHVVDKQTTAEKLSPIINMSVEDILKLLNKDVTQVELGPGGRGITELVKEQIEALELPGIEFIQTRKRFYPNGDFLSYVIGYAKSKDDGSIVGEMGIESYYNERLSGTDGYYKYVKDKTGIRIPNTPTETKAPVDGYDIYLTVDNNIQFFAEQASKEAYNSYNPEWVSVTVANAKTGAILATTTTPGFDPNTRNIKNYLNSLVSYAYEPGSTMKTYTYMAAMEKGVYDGSKTFTSGSIKIGDDTVRDWNRTGWGTINFDVGYALSANTGASYMMQTMLSGNDLKDYLKRLGFGEKTGISLSNELSGKLNFKYPIEVANASFGQGITTTPIQHIKALTSISNNGVLLNPYIIAKIVDPNTNEIIFEGKKSEVGRVASDETVKKMKQLMYNVVHGEPGQTAGRQYNVDGISLIGKTGTAQIADLKNGGYLTGVNDYIRSFEGMFPYEDPEIIIYVAVKGTPNANATTSIVKSITTNISKYLKLSEEKINTDMVNYEMPSYVNKNINDVKKELESKLVVPVILGSGDKVIKQYPSSGISVMSYDKVFLLTNDFNVKMPNIIGYSAKDVISLSNILGLNYKLNGSGFVTTSSVQENGEISDITTIEVTLEEKIKTDNS